MRARDLTLCLLPPAAAFAIGWATAPVTETGPAATPAASPIESASSAPMSGAEWSKLDRRQQSEHILRQSTEELRAIVLTARKGNNQAIYLAYLAGEELGRRLGKQALDALADLPAGNARELIRQSIVSGWSDTDPLAAAGWALEADLSLASEIVDRIAGRQPQRASELLGLPGMTPDLKEIVLDAAASQLLARSHEEALAWLDTLAPDQQALAIPPFLEALAPLDPERAGELLKTLPVERWDDHASEIAMQWVWSDPAAAMRWLDTLPPNDAAWGARVAAWFAWAGADPAAAWNHLAGLGEDERKAVLSASFQPRTQPLAERLLRSGEGVAEAGVREWMQASGSDRFGRLLQLEELRALAKRDPQTAIARAGELGDNDAPALLLDPLIKELAQRDLPGALELAQTFPSYHSHNAINQTIKMWAARDPAGALTQIESMPPGKARNSALNAFVYQNLSADPETTARVYIEHLESLPEGDRPTGSDHQASNIVHTWFNSDPTAAGEWAASLEQHATRASALGKLHELWKQYDPDTATGRLEALGISADEIRALSR